MSLQDVRLGRRAVFVARSLAYGGGVVSLLGGLGYGLLVGEAKLARRTVRPPEGPPHVADGRYGRGQRAALRLVLLGDSAAASVGASGPPGTVGALLAKGLAEATGRPVRLRVLAVSGARSADLDAQVARALADEHPDIAVVSIGANDVTHRVESARAVDALRTAVETLTGAGVKVVVGTCPDLGTVRPIAQPLRALARVRSRRLAAAQDVAVRAAGGTPVAIGKLLADRFQTSRELFSEDRFHPSDAGYELLATALLPHLREAAGLRAVNDDLLAAVTAVQQVKDTGQRTSRWQRAHADRLVGRFWSRLRRGGPDTEPEPSPALEPPSP